MIPWTGYVSPEEERRLTAGFLPDNALVDFPLGPDSMLRPHTISVTLQDLGDGTMGLFIKPGLYGNLTIRPGAGGLYITTHRPDRMPAKATDQKDN